MDRKKIVKYLRNFAFFVALIALTFWIIFKDQDGRVLLETLKNSDIKFIVIGFATMFVFLCMEAINIGRMLKHLGEKSTFLRNLKYTLIGFFFSAITPAASRRATDANILYAQRWHKCREQYSYVASQYNLCAVCHNYTFVV